MSFSLWKMLPSRRNSKGFKPKSSDRQLRRGIAAVERNERDRQPPKIDPWDIHPPDLDMKPLKPRADQFDPQKRNTPSRLLPLNLNIDFDHAELSFVTDISATSDLPSVATLQAARKLQSQEPRRGSFLNGILGKKVSGSRSMPQEKRKKTKADDFKRNELTDPVDIDEKIVRSTSKSEEFGQGYLHGDSESPKLNGKPVKDYLDRGIDKYTLKLFKSRNNNETDEEEEDGEAMKLLDNADLVTSSTKTRLPLVSTKAFRGSFSENERLDYEEIENDQKDNEPPLV